ncbi:hypothetical protein [Hyphomicrobium sp.]|uniref:hypothetical protein n=1 Tax=Hyphomicrobium sp. TaxID=82 RepID=UPI001DF6FDB4|nr:hypothetical protein [Hyphomicrobium sp.]MBY0561532.1 hypothetical protein [Hyphomicrobium sp.]
MEGSGYYRCVEQGHPGAEWAEGCGWIVFDELAREQGSVKLGDILSLVESVRAHAQGGAREAFDLGRNFEEINKAA